MEPQLGLVQPQTTDLGQDELAAVEKLQRGYHNMRAGAGKALVGTGAASARRRRSPPQPAAAAGDEPAPAEKLQRGYHNMRAELGKVIVGQQAVIAELLVALFCRGHTLLVGVPGLAKTLLISTLAKTLGLSFNRIQFTPDLMPSDITGTEVIEEDKTTGGRILRYVRGPIFANVILADEINRTPPKTQAALLEAMQEHQVTAGGKQHRLPQPFFVLATQNPIEQEGTYPLPEAHPDRLPFNINVGSPPGAEA